MLGSFLLEFLFLLLPLLLLLVLHLLAVELLQFGLKARVELGDVEFLVPVDSAVHLGLIEGLIQRDFLLTLGLHLHLLRIALDKPSSTSEFLR